MPSRRDAIKMTDAEAAAFLEEEKTVVCATNGKDGWPHLMPLWYVVRDDRMWAWTFAKSQKVANLARDPRATLQIEAGEEYSLLRGVMVEAEVTVHDDPEVVLGVGMDVFRRYAPGTQDADGIGGVGGVDGVEARPLPDDALDALRAQAAKRVALEFVETRRTSWDHRKLSGTY